MIKGIIYDLDGLMVNSEPLHRRAGEKTLKFYGYNYSDLPQDLIDSFIGKRVVDITREIIDYLKIDTEVDDFIKTRRKIIKEIMEKELEMMPGLKESLNFFKKNNFKIAIASSGIREYIDWVLKRFEISDYFDVIVAGDSVKNGKPDPEIFLLTIKKINLKPEECLVLEDAANGIHSAKLAGCRCIGVKSPNTPNQDLSEADIILETLKEIGSDVINNFD